MAAATKRRVALHAAAGASLAPQRKRRTPTEMAYRMPHKFSLANAATIRINSAIGVETAIAAASAILAILATAAAAQSAPVSSVQSAGSIATAIDLAVRCRGERSRRTTAAPIEAIDCCMSLWCVRADWAALACAA
eukprot:scaffold120550_cov28-Tisochrysis_lutea.AAC.2